MRTALCVAVQSAHHIEIRDVMWDKSCLPITLCHNFKARSHGVSG
jgi:hypothetical protein